MPLAASRCASPVRPIDALDTVGITLSFATTLCNPLLIACEQKLLSNERSLLDFGLMLKRLREICVELRLRDAKCAVLRMRRDVVRLKMTANN